MTATPGQPRELQQEVYLQELVLSIYRVYVARMKDVEARGILEQYLRLETERRRRIEEHLAGRRLTPSTRIRFFFSTLGRLYGVVTSWLGTRIMLRIVLSASGSAGRRACAMADAALRSDQPDLQYLATMRARNEGDLLADLRQHLINTRPQRP